MRNLRWQFLIAIGGVILVVGLLIGQTPDAGTVFPQPAPGGIYVEALVGDITRLNPILDIYNQTDRDIDRLIFSGLVRFDSRGMPHPNLADWAVTADATLYTFTIREDTYWHDGQPVTSDDVVYTFSKLQDTGYPGPADLQAMWQDINIIWLDSRRVQFQLPEPFAPFLDYLTIGLLPDHLLRGVSIQDMIDHPFNLQPIGTGPFRFDQFLIEDGEIEGVSLVAFDEYHEGRPFLERVEFHLYDDTLSAFDAYLAGEVQGIGEVELEILPQVLQQPDLNLHTARMPQLSLVLLNTKHAEKTYLAEKTFRQALLLSINRQWIINQALAGQGLIPCGPVQPGTWAFSDSFSPMPFDQIRASELLDALGWELPPGATPGTPEYLRSQDEQIMSLELIYPEGETHAKVAEILKTSWQAVGIEVELISAEPASVLEDYLIPRDFDAVLTDLNLSRYPDPDPYPFWHDSQTETGQNYSGFTDRNISIWLEQARITPDFGRRAELYRNFQHRFQDQSPALLLYYPVYNFALNAQVQGVSIGPLFDPSDRFIDIAKWHLLFQRTIDSEATQESASHEVEE